jgi:hypothetical protein
MTTKEKLNEKDPFDVVRFNEIQTEIKKFNLNKDQQRRLDKLTTVFNYRRDVAYEHHNTVERYEKRGVEERLSQFKSIDFFLNAMQVLLHDVKTSKPEPVKKYNSRRSSWS